MKKLTLTSFAPLGLMLLGLAAMPHNAAAQLITPVFNDATDPAHVSADYKTTHLDSASRPGYPANTTGAAWSAPINPDNGATSVGFNHTNASETTDFLSSANGGGIYHLFSNTAYTITQSSPVSSLSSISLRLYMAAGSDGTATDNLYKGSVSLTLTRLGDTNVVLTAGSAVYSNVTSATIFGSPTTLQDVGFGWDLSGVTGTVTGYTINWAVAQHSILYGTDVTEVSTQAVPEPSTWAMLVAGFAGLVYVGHRRRIHASID